MQFRNSVLEVQSTVTILQKMQNGVNRLPTNRDDETNLIDHQAQESVLSNAVRPSLREDIYILKQENDDLREQIVLRRNELQKAYKELVVKNGLLIEKLDRLTHAQQEVKQENKFISEKLLGSSVNLGKKCLDVESLGHVQKSRTGGSRFQPYKKIRH